MTSYDNQFQRLTAFAAFNRTFDIFTKRTCLFLSLSLLLYMPLVTIDISLVRYTKSNIFDDTMGIMRRYLKDQPSSSCIDSPGWYDRDGSEYDCKWYSVGNRCADHGYSYKNNGKTANEACCTCGGGEPSNQPTSEDIKKSWINLSTDQVIEYFKGIAIYLFITMIAYLVQLAVEGVIIYTVGQLYVDRNPLVLECIKKGFSKLCTLFCTALLVLIYVQIGFFALIFMAILLTKISYFFSIPVIVTLVAWLFFLIYLYISLVILSPIIVIENYGPKDAIKRALDLSQNHHIYIFCTLFCFKIAYYTFEAIIEYIMDAVAGEDELFNIWGVFVAMSPYIIYLPLYFILKTVVYLNIRVEREGMDRGVLMNDLNGMVGPTETAVPPSEVGTLVVYSGASIA